MKTMSVSQLRRVLTSVDALLTSERCVALTRGLVGEKEGGTVFAYLVLPDYFERLRPEVASQGDSKKFKAFTNHAPAGGLDTPGVVTSSVGATHECAVCGKSTTTFVWSVKGDKTSPKVWVHMECKVKLPSTAPVVNPLAAGLPYA